MSVIERFARNISVTSQLFLKSCIILMHSEDLNKFVLQKVEKQLLKNLCRQDDYNDREEGKKTVQTSTKLLLGEEMSFICF